MQERLLTPKEVAQRLNVSIMSIHRWVKSNQIPYVRLSSRIVRFSEQELNKWLKERSIPALRRPSVRR
jgi:excisionase family DNA binding protein